MDRPVELKTRLKEERTHAFVEVNWNDLLRQFVVSRKRGGRHFARAH